MPKTASQGSSYPESPSSLTRVLAAFSNGLGAGTVIGDRTLFSCPVHGDNVPTLSVTHNIVSGAVDVHCSVGCPPSQILSAVGLTAADLAAVEAPTALAADPSASSTRGAEATSQGTFTYLSAAGERLGQVVYGGTGGPRLRKWNPATKRWTSGEFGAHLYRLPEISSAVQAGEPVWILGSETDAQLVAAHQIAATCALGGWDSLGVEHLMQLGAPGQIVVVANRNEAGYRHAVRVRDLISASAPSITVTVVEPAVGMDLGQHFAAGRSIGDLVAVDPARQLSAPADPTSSSPVPSSAALTVAPPVRGGRGGGDDDGAPNRAAIYVHRHGQTVQVRTTRSKTDGSAQRWYDVIWTCEVRVRKITYHDLAEDDPSAPRIPGSWLIELRRRLVDDSGHYVSDKDSIDGFAYETASVTIAAEDFHTPGWPDLLPWAGVVANDTPNGRAKARAAAIAVSGIRSTTPAFAATGWRESNGSAIYVHPGGAIGDSGELMGDVTLNLPARFAPMAMESPVDTGDTKLLGHAVTHGLDPLLTMLPADVAAPIIGYSFRTFLGKPRGSVHLMGAPGTGKTVVARVCGMSWTSTAFHEHGHTSLFTGGDKMDDSMRALALLMHSAKDTLMLVDEFKGRTAQERVNALHTLFWNGQERSVSNTRGQIRRSSGPPRCGLVTTGEVGSVGSSATRTLTLAINRDVVSDPVSVWSHLESAGSRSWRAQLGASFVQWLAADHEDKVAAAQRYGAGAATVAWQQFCASLPHTEGLAGRLVAIAADITVGWSLLVQFLLDRGAISTERADQIWAWAMGGLATQLRAQDHSVGDGAEQLVSLMREAMTSGAGHATDRASGEVPAAGIGGPADDAEAARAFGWVSRGPRSESGTQAWSPRGNHVGVVDSAERMLYLFPRETLATMAALTARVGEHFTATTATITSSLGRRGWLGVEGDGTRRSRIRVAGVLTSVWPVPLAEFYGQDSGEAAAPGGAGAAFPLPPWASRPRIVPTPLDEENTDDDIEPGVGDPDAGEKGAESVTQEILDLGIAAPELTVVPGTGDDQPAAADDASADAGRRLEVPAPVDVVCDDRLPDAHQDNDGQGAGEDGGEGEQLQGVGEEPGLDDTSSQDCAPVALRPLVTAGGEATRWLYASATITDEAMVLPDGEAIPIEFGPEGEGTIAHLGDLVELAASLHLGFGGGRSLPEPPQLLLTEAALAQLGVTLPDMAEEPNPVDVVAAAGAQLMKATLAAGYQTSKAATLRIWTKVWRGRNGAEFVVLPAVSLTDPQSGLLTGTAAPVDLAYRLHRVAELLGTTYSSSGAVTGRRLYERLHPPGGRALTPTELVSPLEPFRKSPGRLAAGTMTRVRPLTADEQRHSYIHGYDMRANYLTAAGKAVVGIGEPEHHRDPVDFDPKVVGLWRVSVGDQQYPGYIAKDGGHTMLPDIMALARGREATTGWFTTTTLKYVVNELDWPVEVHEAYTWSLTRRLWETWAKHINTARLALEEHLTQYPGEPNAVAERGAIKAVYRGFVGRLAYTGDCDDKGRPLTPWYRPDWRAIIQAEANVDLHRKIRKIATTTGRYPVGVQTDELLYTSDESDPVAAKPDPMPLGIGLGKWDLSRSHEITDAVIEAAARRSVTDFNIAVPKTP